MVVLSRVTSTAMSGELSKFPGLPREVEKAEATLEVKASVQELCCLESWPGCDCNYFGLLPYPNNPLSVAWWPSRSQHPEAGEWQLKRGHKECPLHEQTRW